MSDTQNNGLFKGVRDEEYASTEEAKETPSDSEFPEGGTRAWFCAASAAATLFSTFGFANSWGVFQEYYSVNQLQNDTVSAISWIGSLQIFFLFSGCLFGGPLFDKYGGKVFWPAAVLYVFAVMMTSICKTYWQIMLAQGLLGGIAMGLTMAPVMTATGQYFNKKRGAAMGIVVAGSSLGGVCFPIALSKMLNNPNLTFGWTVRICGFIMIALLGPASVGIRARLPPKDGSFFLPSAFRETRFTMLVIAFSLMMLGMFVPFFYLPVYAVQYGMSPHLAFYLPSILNGASFFGRIIPGITADKLGALNMLGGSGLITGILLLCWPKCNSNASIIAFAALYGFFSGALVSLSSVCISRVSEDPRNMGTYLGMGMFVGAFSILIGPPISGALLARYGGYEQVGIFSGVVVLVSAFSILLVKRATGQGMFAKA